ncbi:dihydrofolate reductase family protein [Jatrophihabitans sp. YIM 134969]
MTATYTFDVFSTLDGFGSASGGDWSGYWGKQGPELLEHRLRIFEADQRLVLGGTTYRQFHEMLAASDETSGVQDPWVTRFFALPTTVISSTLTSPVAGPGSGAGEVTIEPGDAVEVVRRLKQESDVPLRSHGSLSMNRALLAAGLVDRLSVTVFPVVTGRNGSDPVFAGAEDFDLELLEQHTLDGNTLELVYRPTLH